MFTTFLSSARLRAVCSLSFVLVMIFASNQPSLAVAPSSERPNIIVIMTDDVGYSDIGCYGGEIQTPTLDSLAAGGMRFTQFYNTARCCPTRAALLTGLYSHQAGIGHMMEKGPPGSGPAYEGELSNRAVTIAEVLKASGYRTYMTGKWHVTKHANPNSEADKFNWPLQRGFDRFYGTIHGAGSFYDPNTLTRDNQFVSPYADPEYKPETYYYTDAISDHAAKFVTEHHRDSAEQPFFMYVAYTGAHWPMHAKESDIAKYKGKYDAGYDPIRTTRLAKMKELGLLDPSWQVSPQEGQWGNIKNKEWESRCMEVYAAMLDSVDQGIGQIVQSLKTNGQFENTLILYLQDNGGCAEPMGRNGVFQARANAPTLPPLSDDFQQPLMIPKQTRDGYPVRQGNGVMPGPADTYIGYGRNWANVSNTPFREYKHWQHEGGISTPLIAHWPTRIQSQQLGSLQSAPTHLIDILATCVDIAGADYPSDFKGHEIQPREGVSLLPTFEGRALERKEPLYWEHEGNRAIREGDWKLVSKHPGDWELYNIAADRTEMNDLALTHPERVTAMAARWYAWAERVGVKPWPLQKPKNANAKRKRSL
jgi:arylsulfatase A-like enzyme